jgi:hypothetical protein
MGNLFRPSLHSYHFDVSALNEVVPRHMARATIVVLDPRAFGNVQEQECAQKAVAWLPEPEPVPEYFLRDAEGRKRKADPVPAFLTHVAFLTGQRLDKVEVARQSGVWFAARGEVDGQWLAHVEAQAKAAEAQAKAAADAASERERENSAAAVDKAAAAAAREATRNATREQGEAFGTGAGDTGAKDTVRPSGV